MKVKTLVLASSNGHKAKELQMLLGPMYKIKTQDSFGVPFVAESGKTFQENAYIKAHQLAKSINYTVIADDSGLEVHCINNEPGIFSARYAHKDATDEENIDKLLEELSQKNHPDRAAKFTCSLVLIENKGKTKPRYFTGELCGEIITKKIGLSGFGYDPVFFLPKQKKTLAELSMDEKNLISHRAKAARSLKQFLDMR